MFQDSILNSNSFFKKNCCKDAICDPWHLLELAQAFNKNCCKDAVCDHGVYSSSTPQVRQSGFNIPLSPFHLCPSLFPSQLSPLTSPGSDLINRHNEKHWILESSAKARPFKSGKAVSASPFPSSPFTCPLSPFPSHLSPLTSPGSVLINRRDGKHWILFSSAKARPLKSGKAVSTSPFPVSPFRQ